MADDNAATVFVEVKFAVVEPWDSDELAERGNIPVAGRAKPPSRHEFLFQLILDFMEHFERAPKFALQFQIRFVWHQYGMYHLRFNYYLCFMFHVFLYLVKDPMVGLRGSRHQVGLLTRTPPPSGYVVPAAASLME